MSKVEDAAQAWRYSQNHCKFFRLLKRYHRFGWTKTIVVAVSLRKESSELLSWAISVAAQPGDHVIALHVIIQSDALPSSDEARSGDGANNKDLAARQAIFQMLKQCKNFCDIRPVKTEVKIVKGNSLESVLIQEATTSDATMLVLGSSYEQALSRGQQVCHLANWCAEQSTGCSLLVVKNRKILQYEEASVKDSCYAISPLSQRGTRSEVQRSPTVTNSSSPTGILKKTGVSFDSKICSPSICSGSDWLLLRKGQVSPAVTDGYSPRGVLERTAAGLDSNGCSPSNRSESFPYPKQFPSLSPSNDVTYEPEMQEFKHSCLNLWRNISVKRQSTFPTIGRTKDWISSSSDGSSKTYSQSYTTSSSPTASVDKNTLPAIALDGRLPWRCFTYEEISIATQSFDPGNLVGKGGQAEVYKGYLPNGQAIAVKKLMRGTIDDQREMAFLQELGIIAHIRHPNTTSLIGFCLDKGLYLILHFLPHGSLASLLHGSNAQQFQWFRRFKVALGTAQGLLYLHNHCQRRTIHRDIKASNILLGPDFEPEISDFGLARWLPEQCTHLTVLPIEGTFGYLAPEYFLHGIVHEKTDVFAFGILLLELISGRQPIDSYKQNIVVWANPYLKCGDVRELVDPRLHGEYDIRELRRIAITAWLCVQHSANLRPCMPKVMELLLDDELDIESADEWKKLIRTSNNSCDSVQLDEYSSNDYEKAMTKHRALVLELGPL